MNTRLQGRREFGKIPPSLHEFPQHFLDKLPDRRLLSAYAEESVQGLEYGGNK